MLICFSSRKGGSGKSTILCSMAGLLALMDYEVLIIDFDEQGTAFSWGEVRTEIEGVPLVSVDHAAANEDLNLILKKRAGKYDFILVDLPGVDSKDNRLKIQHADKIVFPFKPTQADLNTLEAVKALKDKLLAARPEVETYFVLNECPTTTHTERNEARAYFNHFEVPLLPGTIQSRKIYRETISVGLSVCEMNNDKAKAEIEELTAAVLGISIEDLQSKVIKNKVFQMKNVLPSRDKVIPSADEVIQS